MFKQIREWLMGKKTYILGIIAMLTDTGDLFGGLISFAEGGLSFEQFIGDLEAFWAGAVAMTVRAGIGKPKGE